MKCSDAETFKYFSSMPGVTIGGVALPMAKGAKPSKYRNQITKYNGMTFSSKAEAKYAEQLDQMKAAGEIRFWARQVPFMLGIPEAKYVCDFVIWENGGLTFSVDVKGKATAKFLKDKRLWRRYGPCELRIVTKGRVVETVVPECIKKGA